MKTENQLFGRLVTYTGKYYSKAASKAAAGNLVFAKITGSSDDKDGYYIFAPGCEGQLVTLDQFKALKSRVAELERLNDMPMKTVEGGDEVRMTITEYVTDELTKLADAAYKGVATVIRENGVADDDHLATEKAVRDAISTLGTVMDFKGVVEGESLPAVDGYAAGDVVIWNGEEYVLGTDSAWHEIGQVKADEAVLTLTSADENVLTFDKSTGAVTATVVTAEVAENATGVAVAGDVYTKIETAKSELSDRIDDLEEYNENYVDQTAEVKSNAAAITVTPDATAATTTGVTTYTLDIDATELNKLVEKAHKHAATEVDIDAITIDGEAATAATTVQEALQDLYESDKVASAALNDLNERLSQEIAVVGGNAVKVTAAADDFVSVTSESETSESGSVTTTYDIEATLATAPARLVGEAATATGLATDAYVIDHVANVLSWEILTDDEEA